MVVTRRGNLTKQQLLLRTLRLNLVRQGIRSVLKSTDTRCARSEWIGSL